MSKPFRLAELLARVRLRLRPGAVPETFVLRNGDLCLDLQTRQVQAGAVTADLSAREFALAEMFLRHPGQVLSREQLLSHVWGYDYDPGSNVVDVYVRYLRNKIGGQRIATVRGAGYRLVRNPRSRGPRRRRREPRWPPGISGRGCPGRRRRGRCAGPCCPSRRGVSRAWRCGGPVRTRGWLRLRGPCLHLFMRGLPDCPVQLPACAVRLARLGEADENRLIWSRSWHRSSCPAAVTLAVSRRTNCSAPVSRARGWLQIEVFWC